MELVREWNVLLQDGGVALMPTYLWVIWRVIDRWRRLRRRQATTPLTDNLRI